MRVLTTAPLPASQQMLSIGPLLPLGEGGLTQVYLQI
jgi:hypothetical protein